VRHAETVQQHDEIIDQVIDQIRAVWHRRVAVTAGS
jgi:hypothetical protein